MSKDSAPTGLFSKVAQFVRHPTTGWNELNGEAEKGDPHSQQALRDMIERKRRNDFVRKREFAMLRKLRARLGADALKPQGVPSFFDSGFTTRPEDRAGTLKKINEIEAQMSTQWWQTKQRDSAGRTVQPTQTPPQPSPPQPRLSTTQAYGTTQPLDTPHLDAPTQPLTQAPAAAAPADPVRQTATKATAPANTAARPQAPASRGASLGLGSDVGPTEPAALAAPRGDSSFSASGFSASNFYALDVAELAMDPDIEEAAIRFASGDAAAAEQGLLDVLARTGGAAGTEDEWLALLDLYRATGQADAFETRALDFANRFSRSPPQWFSMPEAVLARVALAPERAVTQARATWVAEAELDVHLVTLLAKVLERNPPPWVLDWSALQTIDPAAVARLTQLFAAWARAAVELRFRGASQLLQVLGRCTPSGDRSVDRSYWDLHLAVLRVMNLADEFELKALDFCVTYEISPPAWEPPRCEYRDLSHEVQGLASVAPPEPAPPSHEFVHSTRPGLLPDRKAPDAAPTSSFHLSDAVTGELVGELVGDPSRQLEALDALLGDTKLRVVSCQYLIRVDFSAAGCILNWAAAHAAQGRKLRFVDVHRLISAFFHVIGITEHAEVIPRSD